MARAHHGRDHPVGLAEHRHGAAQADGRVIGVRGDHEHRAAGGHGLRVQNEKPRVVAADALRLFYA